MSNSLVNLYQDAEFQSFLEELFSYNGTFNIEYNVNKKIDYLKQTTFSFKSLGIIDYVSEVDKQFKLETDDTTVIEGSKVYALLETVSFLDSKISMKLSKLVSSVKVQEAIPVIIKTIREPRMMVINRLKQNKYLTLVKLFSYKYLYYLLSPFLDMSYDVFKKDYKIDTVVDVNIRKDDEGVKVDDMLLWLDDISYETISEITKYCRMIEKVLYNKEYTTITSMNDVVVLYLNWVDMKKEIDKLEHLEYLKGLLMLRTNFPYGYVSKKRLLTALSNLHINVRIESRPKPIRTIINKNFIPNLLKYKLVSEEQLSSLLIKSLDSKHVHEAIRMLETGDSVTKVVDKFKLEDPDIYQKLYKEVLQL